MNPLIIHGGDLGAASLEFAIAEEDWIDLSTGINPRAYPFDELPLSAFSRLPYLEHQFLRAAESYYVGKNFLATSGSQAVIQNLYHVLAPYPLIVPSIGYQEYRFQWQGHGGDTVDYPSLDTELAFSFIQQALSKNAKQHLVLIQPNNPSGILFSAKQIAELAAMQDEKAYLIVDEAFMDAELEPSILTARLNEKIVVLRSFGKFFGLAGIRLGFVFAHKPLLAKLENKLNLWAVNGPAQAIAQQALTDKQWHLEAKQQIQKDAIYTRSLFADGLEKLALNVVHKPLFSSYFLSCKVAKQQYMRLAQQGILTRLIEVDECVSLLRIGRVAREDSRLRQRLAVCRE